MRRERKGMVFFPWLYSWDHWFWAMGDGARRRMGVVKKERETMPPVIGGGGYRS